MAGVDFFGKRIGPMQMTRLVGAKSWLRGRSFAIPTLDASTTVWILTRQRASFLMFFFSTECLPWIQIFQDFIGLGFAVGTIQGQETMPCSRARHCMCCMSEGFVGRRNAMHLMHFLGDM